MHDNDDDLPVPPRPPSGSHTRSRAHFHRQQTEWVFVDQPETDSTASRPEGGVDLWVIYKNPHDYPNKYVVRHWLVTDDDRWVDDPPFAVTDTLEAARQAIQPPHRLRVGQYKDSGDPSVFEAWM